MIEMTLFLFPLLIIFVICGIALLLKNQIASTMTNPEYEHNLLLAQQQLEMEYERLFQQYLYTPETLEYIPAAIPDLEIKGVLACKKQTSIAESMLGGVVTTLSGFAKIEHDLCYYLVMGKNTLYNFQYNIKTKRGKILKQFPRSEILTLTINKATFFDDLKQPKKFKLQD